MSTSQSTGFVNSLLHGTRLFDMFSRSRRVVSVGEIAVELDIHKSNASRIAATLASAGYLAAVDGQRGKYQLGSKFVDLGAIAMGNTDLISAASGPLTSLAQDLGDTSHMGVADGLEAITVSVVDGWRAIRMHSYVGKRSPSHASSMGKVLLAGMSDEVLDELLTGVTLASSTQNTVTSSAALRRELSKVRNRGYATDLEELEEGMSCVAAPVFDADGQVVASVSVSAPSSRVTAKTVPERAKRVIETAWQVSRAIGAPASVPAWPGVASVEAAATS